MLIEAAIGDAYGVGFEYRPIDFVTKNNKLEKYFPHERYQSLYKKYSDDTQMSLAIAELMIETDEWTDELIARKFIEVFKRDIRFGYSSKFYNFLLSVNTEQEFITRMLPNSERSGAAMRSGVIGLYSDKVEVLRKSKQQAKLTHNTKAGILAAQASSLIVHYFFHKKGEKKHLGQWIENVLGGDWGQPWDRPVGEKGYMPVRAAITGIIRNNNMQALLKDCIDFSGDVDTVATIALGAASFSSEIENNLPEWMYEELENGKYGRDYLIRIDSILNSKFNPRSNEKIVSG